MARWTSLETQSHRPATLPTPMGSAFLSNRCFNVRVNAAISQTHPILAGVPQGAVLSPTLFNVFINDIPVESTPSISYSTLYADDLATYFTYSADGHLQAKVNTYIQRLEQWLKKNRLEMNVDKTCYTIFAQSPRAKTSYAFKMGGKLIHHDQNPKFLGIVFDERLSFSAHVDYIRGRCSSRLNVLKIISHKSWKLSRPTLVNTYKLLIGSILDYSAVVTISMSASHKKSLQAIQNKAMRIIYRQPFDSHTSDICAMSGCATVNDRLLALPRAHIQSIHSSKPLVTSLIHDYRTQISSIRRENS